MGKEEWRILKAVSLLDLRFEDRGAHSYCERHPSPTQGLRLIVSAQLNQFQEWPQLLDSHLPSLTKPLVESFLQYVTMHEKVYVANPLGITSSASPLPRAVCKVLYTLCKVRGLKVIIRFLNNEPKYIEPMLSCLVHWQSAPNLTGSAKMLWEERYIMLVWLSHLLLAPFDLASISSLLLINDKHLPRDLHRELPNIAVSLLSKAWISLAQPSKEREGASMLIVRLALRPDMQRQGLLQKTAHVVMEELAQTTEGAAISVYEDLGLLSILAGIMNSGLDDDVASLVRSVFGFCHRAATEDSSRSQMIRNSAPARKLLIKIMRASLLHATSLNGRHSDFNFDTVNPMIEDMIQYLLESVADKDTPVRLTASKALSVITLKLELDMAAEVVQAVVDSFSDNMLYQEPGSAQLIAATEIDIQRAGDLRPNFGAVDPLRWHGLMLSLSHLLFRRSPPPHQLASIIQCLLLGLNFEQRSNVGSSVGVSVRDAACFGIWAMSRKYTTKELNAIDVSTLQHLSLEGLLSANATNVVQLLAAQLIVSSCLDPSGNIRRGSSAALQELIGRHPDTVEEGIALVQIVDYHAVARRSRAMSEVATKGAALSPTYYMALLTALLDWRGSRATDAECRRSAAAAIGQLARLRSKHDLRVIETIILEQAKSLKPVNTGNNSEARHGLLLALSAAIDANAEPKDANSLNGKPVSSANVDCTRLEPNVDGILITSLWSDFDALIGDLEGRVTRELELAFEATCVFLSSLARLQLKQPGNDLLWGGSKLKLRIVDILERCQVGSEKETIVDAAAKAAFDLFMVLSDEGKSPVLERWLDKDNSKGPETRCKGRIIALGKVYSVTPHNYVADGQRTLGDFQSRIPKHMQEYVLGSWPIETKISAVVSLSSMIEHLDLAAVDLQRVLLAALTDYTIDQRGDVGSNLRLEGIKAVQTTLPLSATRLLNGEILRKPMQEIAKLSAEKLDKIRFHAWLCLQDYWQKQNAFPPMTNEIVHPADVSSPHYFKQLLDLLEVDWLREHVVQGLVSSAVAGSEDLGRAARAAIIMYSQDHRQTDVEVMFVKTLDRYLKESSSDDRVALPAMELLAFTIEQAAGEASFNNIEDECTNVLEVMQMVHQPTSSLLRVEAALKVYSSLTTLEATRKGALDRLTRMLLHKYPKIRNAVADTIFLHTEAEEMVAIDWSRPTAELKPVVKSLRKTLGVV